MRAGKRAGPVVVLALPPPLDRKPTCPSPMISHAPPLGSRRRRRPRYSVLPLCWICPSKRSFGTDSRLSDSLNSLRTTSTWLCDALTAGSKRSCCPRSGRAASRPNPDFAAFESGWREPKTLPASVVTERSRKFYFRPSRPKHYRASNHRPRSLSTGFDSERSSSRGRGDDPEMTEIEIAHRKGCTQARHMPIWRLRLAIWVGRHRHKPSEPERMRQIAMRMVFRDRTGESTY